MLRPHPILSRLALLAAAATVASVAACDPVVGDELCLGLPAGESCGELERSNQVLSSSYERFTLANFAPLEAKWQSAECAGCQQDGCPPRCEDLAETADGVVTRVDNTFRWINANGEVTRTVELTGVAASGDIDFHRLVVDPAGEKTFAVRL